MATESKKNASETAKEGNTKALGFREELELPPGITADVNGDVLVLKGQKGEAARKVGGQNVAVKVENNRVVVSSGKHSKREKKLVGSFRAHILNLIRGVSEGHVYRLKVCYVHFPITVSVSGSKLLVKNFLGEKTPRELDLSENVKVQIEGAEVVVESADKETAGLTAAAIEQLTRRADYDTRVFADGIYIISKDGKEVK